MDIAESVISEAVRYTIDRPLSAVDPSGYRELAEVFAPNCVV